MMYKLLDILSPGSDIKFVLYCCRRDCKEPIDTVPMAHIRSDGTIYHKDGCYPAEIHERDPAVLFDIQMIGNRRAQWLHRLGHLRGQPDPPVIDVTPVRKHLAAGP